MTIRNLAAGTMSAAGAWLWASWGQEVVKKVLEAATDEAQQALQERWERVRWDEAAQEYRKRMHRLHSTVRILGSPRPAPLEGIFTDLFILEQPMAMRRFDLEQLRKDPSQLKEPKRISGLRLVTQAEGHRLFILGKPGAGKTTFCKYLALQAVQGKLDVVPVLISLREWADSGAELMAYLARQFEICGFPDAELFIEHVLEEGQALVLFDGLDEVNQEEGQRDRVIADLRDFSKQYLKSQCLITCRVAATEYQFEQFSYVEIADFTDEQMLVYARKWFADSPGKRDRFLEEFAREEHSRLRELGRVPLLLSMLCLAFDETMRFPQRRVDAYREALDALLKKWDAARGIRRDEIYRRLSPERKQQMLARIAAESFEEGELFFRQEELEEQIAAYLRRLPPADAQGQEVDGEAVLRAIEAQHCIFVERAHRIHSFSHLTFQEYLTAKYVVDNAVQGTLKRLVKGHLMDDRWRQIFLLTASMLDDADIFFELYIEAIQERLSGDEIAVKTLKWIGQAENRTRSASLSVRIQYLNLALAFSLTLALNSIREDTFVRDAFPIFTGTRYLLEVHAGTLKYLIDVEEGAYSNATLTVECSSSLLRDLLECERAVYACIVGFERELRKISVMRRLEKSETIHRSQKPQVDLELVRSLYASHLPNTLERALDLILTQARALDLDIGSIDELGIEEMIQIAGFDPGWIEPEDPASRLRECLGARELFGECLRVAYVSDRAELENRFWWALVSQPGE